MEDLAPLEIRALARIVDELDYYQLLHLERSASSSDLKRAYRATCRSFHPDANRHRDPDLRDGCQRIAKRLTEAYCVLRDARRRRAYDAMLDSGGGRLRMQLAEARAADSKQDSEDREGRTPQGRDFYRRAIQDLERGDTASAVSKLQMALTFEPDNAHFARSLAEARARRD